MAGPLDGLKVVEFCQIYAGPGTAVYLADMGADVIRVEPPGGGRDRAGGELSDSFVVLNRGKRSIGLDIRAAEGREVAQRLIRQSDVMIVAWRPGQAERLGYGYEQVRESNPRLVYASITGWGNRGPLAQHIGYDRLIQAHTGLMAARPAPDGTPLEASFYPADQAIPMLLGYGIMLALWVRERTGEGQKVETSQLEAMIAIQSIHLVQRDGSQPAPAGEPAWRPPHTYPTADSAFVVIAPITDAEWATLWKCLHLPEDSRFATAEGRGRHLVALHELLARPLAKETSAVWVQRLTAAGLGCAKVRDRAEFMAHPHAWENGMLVKRDDPNLGTIEMVGVPLRLSSTPGSAGQRVPEFGEHSDRILRELAYSDAAIEAMRQSGAVQ